jgi:hypothetical protein
MVCALCECPITRRDQAYRCVSEEVPPRELWFHRECLETEGARVIVHTEPADDET